MKIFGLLILSVCYSYAIVFGGTNLSFSNSYPEHNCKKPYKPFKPIVFNDRWQIDSYNLSIATYNYEIEKYIRCIKEYLENADNDIKRIQEKQQEVIDDVNKK